MRCDGMRWDEMRCDGISYEVKDVNDCDDCNDWQITFTTEWQPIIIKHHSTRNLPPAASSPPVRCLAGRSCHSPCYPSAGTHRSTRPIHTNNPGYWESDVNRGGSPLFGCRIPSQRKLGFGGDFWRDGQFRE